MSYSPMNNYSDYEIGYDQDSVHCDSSDDYYSESPPGEVLSYDPNQLSNHPSGIPVNGHDFLKMVKEEKEKLPSVLSAKKPPPPAPSKMRDQNESISMGAENNEAIDCSPREQSFDSTSSSERLFTPARDNEPSPRRQLGIEPLSSSSIFLPNTSSDNNCDQSYLADVSMAVSESDTLNRSNCSIMSSSVFREKIKLKSSLLNNSKGQTKTLVGDCSTRNRGCSSVVGDGKFCQPIIAGFLKLRSVINQQRNKQNHGSKPVRSDDIDDDDDDESEDMREQKMKELERKAEPVVGRILCQMSMGKPPSCGELVDMEQYYIHSILERLADRYERTSCYTTLHGDWIHSLMACLREPIEADICSTLRRLAKFCINRRNMYEKRQLGALRSEVVDMEQDDSYSVQCGEQSSGTSALTKCTAGSKTKDSIDKEEYLACILIICIVHHVFKQTDLK